MRFIRYYFISIIIVIACLVLLTLSGKNKKDSAVVASQLILKQGDPHDTGKYSPLSASETLAVKQMIYGLAKSYNLDLDVSVSQDSHIRVGLLPPKDAAVKPSDPGMPSSPPPPDKEKDGDHLKEKIETLLSNYDSVIGFLDSVAALPYVLDYEGGCLGIDCPAGLELSIVGYKLPTT